MTSIDSFRSEIAAPSRLAILMQSGLLDTQCDEAFDRLTRLACRLLEAPAAFVVLMDDERQFFKSAVGLSAPDAGPSGMPLSDCLARRVVASGEPLVIADARTDPRAIGARTIGDLEAVSYLGCPLALPDGLVLGAFSIVDRRPRTWTDDEVELMRDLARSALTEIRLDLAVRQGEERERAAAAEQEMHARLLRDVDAVVWEADPRTLVFTFVSQRAESLCGYPISRWLNEPGFWASLIHPEDREQALRTCAGATAAGQDHVFDYRIITADGSVLWLRDIVRVILNEDREPVGLRGVLVDISAQKHAQEQVERVVSSALCLLWQATVEVRGRELHWDLSVLDEAAAQRFLPLDVPPGLTYGAAWQGQRLSESASGDADAAAQAILTGMPRYTRGYCCRNAAGENRWLFDDVRIESLGPTRRRLVGVTTDVTQQKATESELRARKARFRAIFDEAGIGIALVALSGRLVESNRALQNWLGYTDDELVEMDFLRFTHPDDVSLDWELTREILSGARDSYQVEKRYLRKDGRLVWGRLTVSAVRDQDGAPVFLVAMLEDVTAQRRSEERNGALLTLGERLNLATTPKEAAQVVLDVADELFGWDCCWVELVDAEGKRGAGVISMDLLDGVRCEVDAVLMDGKPSPFTLQVFEEGALMWLRDPANLPAPNDPGVVFFGDVSRPSASLMCAPIRNGTRVIGALSIQSYDFNAYDAADLDILQALADYCAGAFERTQAEAARQELQQRLVQAQKMEAVGRLAGGVAHDFNNMLAVINGYSEILLSRGDTSAASRGPLEEMQRAGRRAASLTRQLLAFSRKEIIQPQVLNLGEVVLDIRALLRGLVGEDIELETRRSAAVGLVNADPGQIEQVVMNLALNARDAMPQGGRLSLEVQNTYLHETRECGEGVVPAGHYVCLIVSDTGCGMSPETVEHVFEPFFTTKPTGQGTGLGLATVHGIVKQNRGHIEVESREGQGSTFRVFLPRIDEPDSRAETARDAPPHGKGTILVAEDEEMLRRLVSNLLTSSGYEVLTAMNTDEALLRCKEHSGPIDLLLTDIVMPGRSGRELAALATELYPGLKVIYMSGYMDDDVIRRGVSSAEAHFLQKPFSLVSLSQKVQEVLECG